MLCRSKIAPNYTKNLQLILKHGHQLHCLFPIPVQSLTDNLSILNVLFPAKTLHLALVLFSATLPVVIIAYTSRPITLLTDPEIIILPS